MAEVNVSIVPKRRFYVVRRGDLVAHVRRGCAHRDARVETCRHCDGQPWGWRVVRG